MKDSIGLSLKVFLHFILTCLVLTLAGSLVYMVYCAGTTLVAGTGSHIFSWNLLLKGIFVFLPVSLMFSQIFGMMYLIRHPLKKSDGTDSGPFFLPVFAFVILGLAIWFILMPVSINAGESIGIKSISDTRKPNLSPGIFRGYDEGVYYFTSVEEDGKATGVFLNNSSNTVRVLTYDNLDVSNMDGEFADPLVERTIRIPRVVRWILDIVSKVMDMAKMNLDLGFWNWICFASMGIALTSLVGLIYFSRWRLISVLVSVSCFLGCVGFNGVYYLTNAFDLPKKTFASLFARMPFIKNPFPVVVNLAIALVMIALGIFLAIRHKKTLIRENAE